jgi:3-deoxy-D-manno-octulosonic-acid transferase
VLLVDSIGELAGLYSLADVAFVGGSLVPRGGHNILEPAQYGIPILVGEHTENFRDIVELFKTREAVRVVNSTSIASAFLELLSDDAQRSALGRRAAETLRSQQGATQFTLSKVRELVGAHEVTPA